MRKLKRHIRDNGPVSPADFDSERIAGGFNTVKATTKALEYLYYHGEVQIAGRTQHFHRVFDLTERVLPEGGSARRLPRRDLEAFCVRSAAWVLKLATPEQLARRAALHLGTWRGGGIVAARKAVKRAIEAGALVATPFAKSPKGQPFLVLAEDAARPLPDFDDTIRLIPPLDNLLFSRERLTDFFDIDFKFEAYTPRHKRRFYFALPILQRDRVVGLIDAKKDGETWRVVGLELHARTNRDELRRATHRLAGIAGATRVACSDAIQQPWRRALDGTIDRWNLVR
jgi:uncharacterized protein YcaQ